MVATTVKEETRGIVERLPDGATWDYLQYEIYVRQQIEAGLKDAQEGRLVPIEEVIRKFEAGLL